MLKIGNQAPDFEISDQDGNAVRLANLRGKRVLIWFYPKADTPGWTTQGLALRDRAIEVASKRLTVLGASFDSIKDNKAFKDKFDFPFSLLCDVDRSLALSYHACDKKTDGYPKRISYVINERGDIILAYEKVDPANHLDQILEDLS